MSEREVTRLAQDMRSGDAQDAANVIRHELQTHPQQALQELRQASNIAGPNARLHLGHKPDGDMALVDNSHRAVVHLGHLQQGQYGNNFNRYQDSSYLNGANRYQDNRYQDNRYQDNRYQDNNQGRYQDSYFNGSNGRPQDMSYLNNRYDGYQNNTYLNGRVQDGYYNQNQGQVGRLANDLARGDARDAVYTVQNIMRSGEDPSRAINEANRLADQQACRMGYRSAMEHIAQTRNGDLAVVDQYGRQVARIENCQNGYDSRYSSNNGYDQRYSTYPPNNSSYYQSGSSYYDGRPSYAPVQSGYYNNGYDNRYNNSYDNSYYPQQRINGGQAAAAIGIGIVGGLILSNIGRNNNHNFHRGRW